MYGSDAINFPCIGTAENEAVIHITLYSSNECLRDAIGGSRGITGLQAVEAVRYRDSFLPESAYERIQKCTARHMNRTLDDGHIILFGIYIHLFEFIGSITFLGGYEAGSHLYTRETEGEVVLDILFIKHAAAEDDWDFLFEFFFKSFDDS